MAVATILGITLVVVGTSSRSSTLGVIGGVLLVLAAIAYIAYLATSSVVEAIGRSRSPRGGETRAA